MIKQFSLLSMIFFIMIACGDSAKPLKKEFFDVTAPASCSQRDRNQFIYDVLKDSYLWSDKVKALNPLLLDMDDASFLDHYLFKEKDRFSFVISRTLYEEEFRKGTAKDFGFLSAQREDKNGNINTIVAFVYPDSPAAKAGLKRSDRIASLGGDRLQVLSVDGEERNITLHATEYNVTNVLYQKEFIRAHKKIGYFFFKSFVGPHLIENLDNAFARFKAYGIQELIIDLRYNGGGLLDVATHLGTLIAGYKVQGHILQTNRYNAKYSDFNSYTYFDNPSFESLSLHRVIFLTTQNTASASESLINGLRARENNIEVITIGRETYGKPYGMHTMAYCDKVLVPIQFASENSEGAGGFINGLTPTCEKDELFARNFADENETLLSAALYYIDHGECKK